MARELQLGIIGLGKMGSSLALQCVDRGIYVVGHSAHRHPALEKEGVRTTPDYADMARMLKTPRLIYLSLPAGPTVDEVLGELVAIPHKRRRVDGRRQLFLPRLYPSARKRWQKKVSITWIAAPAAE